MIKIKIESKPIVVPTSPKNVDELIESLKQSKDS